MSYKYQVMQALQCADKTVLHSLHKKLCSWWSAPAGKDWLLEMQLPKTTSSMFHSPQWLIPFGATAGQAKNFAFSCSLLLTQAHIEFPCSVCPVAPLLTPLDEFIPIWEHALFIRALHYG